MQNAIIETKSFGGYVMEDIIIRSAAAADAEAVGAIAKIAWKPIFDGYRAQLGDEIFTVLYPTDPLDKKEAEVKQAVEKGVCFVAEYEGKVVGFATYMLEGKVGVLGNNAVALRGRGIAGLLHARIFEELRALGCEVARVRTGLDDAHAPARRAYEKDGFTNILEDITYFKKL